MENNEDDNWQGVNTTCSTRKKQVSRSRSYTPRKAKEIPINYSERNRSPSPIYKSTVQFKVRHASRGKIRIGSVDDIRGKLEKFKFSSPGISVVKNKQIPCEVQSADKCEEIKKTGGDNQCLFRLNTVGDRADIARRLFDVSTKGVNAADNLLHSEDLLMSGINTDKSDEDTEVFIRNSHSCNLHMATMASSKQCKEKSPVQSLNAFEKEEMVPEEVTNHMIYKAMLEIKESIKELKVSNSGLEERLKQVETTHADMDTRLQNVEKTAETWDEKNMDSLATKKSVTEVQYGINSIIEEIRRCHNYIEHQDIRLKELAIQSKIALDKDVKNCMMVSGIPRTVKDEDCVALVSKFIRKVLLVKETIPIVKAYRLGGTDREKDEDLKDLKASPIVFTLTKPGHKGVLYQHVGNLKGVKNKRRQIFLH